MCRSSRTTDLCQALSCSLPEVKTTIKPLPALRQHQIFSQQPICMDIQDSRQLRSRQSLSVCVRKITEEEHAQIRAMRAAQASFFEDDMRPASARDDTFSRPPAHTQGREGSDKMFTASSSSSSSSSSASSPSSSPLQRQTGAVRWRSNITFSLSDPVVLMKSRSLLAKSDRQERDAEDTISPIFEDSAFFFEDSIDRLEKQQMAMRRQELELKHRKTKGKGLLLMLLK
jgi:hypothetical protein